MKKMQNQIIPEIKNAIENLPTKPISQEEVNKIIVRQILSGKNPRLIREDLQNGIINPDIHYSDSQARNLIYVVRKQMKQEFSDAKENMTGDLFARFEDLYEKAYTEKDYKECREILRDLAKFNGYGQNQVQINKPDEAITITFN